MRHGAVNWAPRCAVNYDATMPDRPWPLTCLPGLPAPCPLPAWPWPALAMPPPWPACLACLPVGHACPLPGPGLPGLPPALALACLPARACGHGPCLGLAWAWPACTHGHGHAMAMPYTGRPPKAPACLPALAMALACPGHTMALALAIPWPYPGLAWPDHTGRPFGRPMAPPNPPGSVHMAIPGRGSPWP